MAVATDIAALTMVQTDAGLAASFNADDNGIQLRVASLAFGDAGTPGQEGGAYTPSSTATRLRRERARIALGAGERIDPHTILVQGVLGEDGVSGPVPEFWAREIGVYDEDGVLLALWAGSTPRWFKSSGVPVAVAYSLAFRALPAEGVGWVVGAPSVNIVLDAELQAQVAMNAELMRMGMLATDRVTALERRVAGLESAEKRLALLDQRLDGVDRRFAAP